MHRIRLHYTVRLDGSLDILALQKFAGGRLGFLGNWARGHTTPKTRSPSRDPLSVCASFVGNLIEPYRFAPRLRRQFKERLWLLVNASDRATAGRTAER